MKRMVTALMVCSMIIGIASIASADARNFWVKPMRFAFLARFMHADLDRCDFDALEDAFDAYFSAADSVLPPRSIAGNNQDGVLQTEMEWSTGVPVAGAHTVE